MVAAVVVVRQQFTVRVVRAVRQMVPGKMPLLETMVRVVAVVAEIMEQAKLAAMGRVVMFLFRG